MKLVLTSHSIPAKAQLFSGDRLINTFNIESPQSYTVDFIRDQDENVFTKIKIERKINEIENIFGIKNIEILENKKD